MNKKESNTFSIYSKMIYNNLIKLPDISNIKLQTIINHSTIFLFYHPIFEYKLEKQIYYDICFNWITYNLKEKFFKFIRVENKLGYSAYLDYHNYGENIILIAIVIHDKNVSDRVVSLINEFFNQCHNFILEDGKFKIISYCKDILKNSINTFNFNSELMSKNIPFSYIQTLLNIIKNVNKKDILLELEKILNNKKILIFR